MKVTEITQEAIEKEMKKAVESSKDYQLALAVYADCMDKKLRIENAIKQLTDEEAVLQKEKEHLTTNFGEEDPLGDTDRMEKITIRLQTIRESRELMQKGIEPNSKLLREKEDAQHQVKDTIRLALPEIREKYQSEIDEQVGYLIQTIDSYRGALTSFFNCKTKGGKHTVYIGSLGQARIVIKDIHELERRSDEMPLL